MKAVAASKQESRTATQDILAEARRLVESEVLVTQGYDEEDNLQARMAKRALEATLERTQTLRSIQMQLIATLARDNLFLAHPPTDDYPDGYGSIGDLLTDAGFTSSTKSYLRSVGEVIAPYCYQHDLPIENYLGNSQLPKLVYAISALRGAIKEQEHDEVRSILKDVETFISRENIAAKYHKPQGDGVLGHGTTIRLHDGTDRVMIVLVLDNDEESTLKAVYRLRGLVDWGLPAAAKAGAGRITVTISD